MPPYEPGLFITELSSTHNLLFNKFCICREHVLCTTKQMERQDSPVTVADFQSIWMTMQSLKAFVFFNRGFNSGMSILHKHFQLIPFASFGREVLPVENAILDMESNHYVDGKICQYRRWAGVKHCFKVFNKAKELEPVWNMLQLHERARYLLDCYHECLNELGIDENTPADQLSFNLWVTPRMMFLVERR